MREFYARARKLASSLASRGIGSGDTVSVMLANTPRHARSALRRADDRRGAARDQHKARCNRRRLHARPCRYQGADRRYRVRAHPQGGAAPDQGQAAARSTTATCECGVEGERLGNLDYEAFIADGDAEFRLGHAVGRVERHLAELHERHHRQSQGRGLSSSRRGADVLRQRRRHRHGAAPGLSVDAADVPLQRLVLSLVACRCVAGTHVCLRSVRAKQIYDAIAEHKRDASLRRALRHVGAAQRHGRGAALFPAARRLQPCRRASARRRARQDGRGGLRAHPSLRADRDLRPGDAQRMASGLGRVAERRAARQAHPPGRALPRARGSRR